MLLQVCVLRDSAIDSFGTPYFVTHVGAAIRGFTDAVNTASDLQVYKHPEDFELYHLGIYNDQDGTFEMLAKPRQLSRGADVKSVK